MTDLLVGVGGQKIDADAFLYGTDNPVPPAGTLQLQGPGNTLVGYRIPMPGQIVAVSIQVDVADGTRTYNLEVRKNGVAVVTLALVGTGVNVSGLSVSFVAGDVLTVFMVKTAGAGLSTFSQETAVVEVAI